MDNKATTKRMIGAVVLVLVAALLLAWLLKGKNRDGQQGMAMDQTAETKPILGFPGVGGGDEQKPSVVGEGENVGDQTQQQGIGMTGTDGSQEQAGAAQQNGGLIPGVEVKMPETVANTTGLSVRPGGEVRDVVDTDGQVKKGTGSMGTGDAQSVDMGGAGSDTAGGATQGKQQASASKPATGGSASLAQQDKPASSTPPTSKPASSGSSKVVLVNERPVPKAQSTESAAAKAAAEKAAAEKAAAAKAKDLAATPAANAGKGNFSIQVIASSDKAKAEGVATPLRADGYDARVSPANVGGKTVYRVSIGGFTDRAAAEATQAKMKSRYSQNQHVQSSFVTSK
ncbi:SPOR domain-containing protein [Thiothrix nivea]|uniref:Sporulation domain-containing protein n=1 Tax=Thiothrix nivea (strain ATCC 35100 / DSM 5205 / JP2) TaxID=870187 RepID=A0A656HDA1_THINJ|nr:SPOR domain-containing protein [Thiothrix nivea]EIJ33954.1 Sporulation domain-containing protein [Thiothrix nivea DSM 5205]